MRSPRRCCAGLTLVEMLIAVSVMGFLAYTTSAIYFSVLHVYNQQAWKLPPYDAATAAVQRVSHDLREAILIEDYTTDKMIIAWMPARDANNDLVLELGADNKFHIVPGDHVKFYLSDETGNPDATGTCLWKAVQHPDEATYTPQVKIADNIRPDLNPVDPDTGLTRPMFQYWPNTVNLWGVEMWMTSTAVVHGKTMTQTAHSESYIRN